MLRRTLNKEMFFSLIKMADWDDEEFELDDNKLEGPRYSINKQQ